jgi:putative proteasome-type protease
MMSTARANLSVGPPYDGCIYLNDSLTPIEFRIESDSPLLETLRETWERQMLEAVAEVQQISQAHPTFVSVRRENPA